MTRFLDTCDAAQLPRRELALPKHLLPQRMVHQTHDRGLVERKLFPGSRPVALGVVLALFGGRFPDLLEPEAAYRVKA
jgi:hypothetical protein